MYRILVVSGVLVATLCWFAISQRPSAAQNFNQQRLPTWQYRELEVHGGHFDRTAANEMGHEGWELVSTFTPLNRDGVNVLVFTRRK